MGSINISNDLFIIWSEGDLNIQHTHNINLELAFNYGIPVSILLTYLVSIILASSLN